VVPASPARALRAFVQLMHHENFELQRVRADCGFDARMFFLVVQVGFKTPRPRHESHDSDIARGRMGGTLLTSPGSSVGATATRRHDACDYRGSFRR
jgi:hypothetical protein